jgi:hypothetical protein
MASVEEHKIWLRETTRRFLQRIARWRRRLKLWLTVGGALLAGTAGAAANLLDQQWRWPLYAVQIIGLLMVAAGAALIEYLDENTAEAIDRAGDLARTVEQRDAELASLEEDYSFSVRLQAVAVLLRGIVDEVAASGPGSLDTQRGRLGSMLDLIVADRVSLFGMDVDRFNFAIYIYEEATQVLNCVACRRPHRMEEDADHRSWEPGEGHVGMAFQGKREYIAEDTSKPDARQIFDAPEPKRRPDDLERYRSIASIPIRLGNGDPVGVLVATSDVAGRFYLPNEGIDPARDPVEPLRVLAREVALIFELTDLYRRVGVDES